MDPRDEIHAVCLPYYHQYKSGRVVRLMGTAVVPAALDPTTGVTSKDITIDPATGITARLYLPNPNSNSKRLPILVYFHGGGFCIESAFSPTYQPFLNSLAAKSRLLIVSVNYRLAPEHPLPAAYHDSWAALNWVFSPSTEPWVAEHGDPNRVFVSGDSAGANIAHQMAIRAGSKSEAKLEGMVLIHPYFWGSEPVGSESEMLDPERKAWLDGLWKLLCSPGMEDLDDPMLNPMAAKGAPRLAGLGCERVMVCVAEKDVLAERARVYYEAVKRSGWKGEVELVESEGEDHVFHLDKPDCDKAAELLEKIAGFFRNPV